MVPDFRNIRKSPKISIIFDNFDRGFGLQFSGKFLVSFAKFLDIRNQGKYTGLVSKSESPKSPKYRESRKSENLRQTHGLTLNCEMNIVEVVL